jgi:hypothetical protein
VKGRAVHEGGWFRDSLAISQTPEELQALLDRCAAARTEEARDGKVHRQAGEPRELFWIDGASHVDLYDKDEYVSPAVDTPPAPHGSERSQRRDSERNTAFIVMRSLLLPVRSAMLG